MRVLEILEKLIAFQTITPNDDGCMAYIESLLKQIGFTCEILEFGNAKDGKVLNLYAEKGEGKENLCFAGHVDVVSPGDVSSWQSDPFTMSIRDGKVFGRGSVDMKGAIACFIAACEKLHGEQQSSSGRISLLITGDEEGEACFGTREMLKHISSKGKKISHALVGEPTNPSKVGDMVKIGRRGSINFNLEVRGTQGHVAYPSLADNPCSRLAKILNDLIVLQLDQGTEFFSKSNLEITSIDVGNTTSNVIPAKAEAKFNIRFNNLHTGESLIKLVHEICVKHTKNYTLNYGSVAECFLSEKSKLSMIISQAIFEITGNHCEFSTSGGTSDARFIKDYAEVAEFGLINQTAHKVDEYTNIEDLKRLTDIYYLVIKKYC